MLFDLIGTETSPLSLSEQDVAALAACGRGTILLDVAARADATLIAFTGTNGRITLSLRAGRLDGEQVLGAVGLLEGPSGAGSEGGIQRRVLDAEDALGLDDGRPHTIAITVNETGTHLYADGYECFSTTLTAFLAQIGLTDVRIDPDGIATVTRLAAWAEPLSDRAVMAQSLAATPLVQFAANELSARDARRTGALTTGSIRALLRTRGRGQGGTIIAASGQGGTLHLDIDAGGLSYRVLPGEDRPRREGRRRPGGAGLPRGTRPGQSLRAARRRAAQGPAALSGPEPDWIRLSRARAGCSGTRARRLPGDGPGAVTRGGQSLSARG